MRFPSLYSSANNHLIAEAAGLYVLGALVPSLPDAAQYRAYGRNVLIEEAEKQIHADGVGAEQSPTYTAFVLEFYATALAVAPVAGDTFPPMIGERLGAALQFLRWITDDNGNQPRFGDDDEGRVFVSKPDFEKYYVASIMSGLSVATGRAELAPPIAVPHLRDLFLGRAATLGAAPSGLRSFDEGGYSVFRQPIAGHDVMLAFDHGPLGYLSIAAHGHADALSVWMHVDGQPVIIDAGTYLYHAGGADRDRFRGTGAHNTLLVNNTDQSTIVGAFNWSHKAKSWRVPAVVGDGDGRTVTARHDGYRKVFGVVHERQVELTDTGFVISDRLEGALAGITDTRLHYCLDPAITPRLEQDGAITLLRDGAALIELTVRSAAGETLTPELAETDVSPQFGTKSQTHAIAVTVPKHLRDAGGTVSTTMRFV